MKIEVQFDQEKLWTVAFGDKSAPCLTWEEMLGVVIQLTKDSGTHCLRWLKTQEEHIREWQQPTEFLIEPDDIKSIEDKL
jgi:hypothetical protein